MSRFAHFIEEPRQVDTRLGRLYVPAAVADRMEELAARGAAVEPSRKPAGNTTAGPGDGIIRSAEFSPCETWRYALVREWDETLPRLLFILLNPSTADATHDDQTNRRGIGFAKRWGYGSVVFVNLFGFRTPQPSELRLASDPVGPENDHWIGVEAARADRIVAAWGIHGTYRRRNRAVMRMVSGLYCLGLTRGGHPKHLVRLPNALELVPFDLKARRLEQSA